MPEIFISYSTKDSMAARNLYNFLSLAGVNAFLADISLKPGVRWKDDILANLKESKWFLFLATPHSCGSDAVKHEIGAALVLNKNLVPILIGIKPIELPDWVKDKQAIDANNPEQVQQFLTNLAAQIRSERAVGNALILGLLLAAVYAFSKD